MTVVGVAWLTLAARDMHLLPGLASPRLDQLLGIRDSTRRRPDGSRTFRGDSPPDGVTVDFRANFTEEPEAHGVTLDQETGEVTVDRPLPAGPRLRSFIVTATVQDGTREFTLRRRFYVHDEIRWRWLTPSTLTVREGTKNMRFTVLARFDDGVIGDITNWSPRTSPKADELTYVHRQGDPTPLHRWTPRLDDNPAMHVDMTTGVITCTSPTALATVAVQIDLGNELARGKAKGAPPWDTPVKLTRVAGKGFPHILDVGVRNVLFLPDGFVDADKDLFHAQVRGIVGRLNTNPLTSPFDLLSARFNYFAAWVPSPQGGVCVLNELVPRPDRDGDAGNPTDGVKVANVPLPVPMAKPEDPLATLTLPELIDVVGLPAPVFDPTGSPLGTDAAGRAHDWQELYGPRPTVARTTGVYDDWLALNDRLLANERDTAFHLAHNHRPQITDPHGGADLSFHPYRFTDDDLDEFLGALRDDKGDRLRDADGEPITPPWVTGERDDTLIVFLCRSNFVAGANHNRYLAFSLLDDRRHRVRTDSDGIGFDLVPDPIPPEVTIDTWTTAAHELAHSFQLDDEYGGDDRKLDANDVQDIAERANVQTRASLLMNNSLEPEKIKWRWPRLEKAGVLVKAPADRGRPEQPEEPEEPEPEEPTEPDEDVDVDDDDDEDDEDADDDEVEVEEDTEPGVGPFVLTLWKGHAKPFVVGDIIRLRRRPLAESGEHSDRLRVTKVDKATDTLEAVLHADGAIVLSRFPEGSVVMVPRRFSEPMDDGLGGDIELIHAKVLLRIQQSHNPLNTSHTFLPDHLCPGEFDVPTPALNFENGKPPNPPRFSSWIVGLYDNGHVINCGVYRPTGICIMTKPHFRDEVLERERAYQFCMVCRYTLVDEIDPGLHGKLDRDYQKDYPT